MEILNNIFGYYDKLLSHASPFNQHLISLLLLAILIWQIFMILKHGRWIFVAVLIIMLPGTWPAAKDIGALVFSVFKFLFIRIIV